MIFLLVLLGLIVATIIACILASSRDSKETAEKESWRLGLAFVVGVAVNGIWILVNVVRWILNWIGSASGQTYGDNLINWIKTPFMCFAEAIGVAPFWVFCGYFGVFFLIAIILAVRGKIILVKGFAILMGIVYLCMWVITLLS